MYPYRYEGVGMGLRIERKAGWASGRTIGEHLFIHGSPVEPAVVKRYGLSPQFSQELIVDDTGKAIAGGKMLFAFRVIAGNQEPVSAKKPKAVDLLWGSRGHSYVFKVPEGTTYWCDGGTIQHGREVAFPYVFESADIVSYWKPGKSFEVVSWHLYTSKTVKFIGELTIF